MNIATSRHLFRERLRASPNQCLSQRQHQPLKIMNVRAVSTLIVSALVTSVVGCVGPRQQPESAIYCPTCRTMWVEMTDFDDPYRMSTVPVERMECPECESAVAHFFKTGKFEHACSTCGDEFVHCKAH